MFLGNLLTSSAEIRPRRRRHRLRARDRGTIRCLAVQRGDHSDRLQAGWNIHTQVVVITPANKTLRVLLTLILRSQECRLLTNTM